MGADEVVKSEAAAVFTNTDDPDRDAGVKVSYGTVAATSLGNDESKTAADKPAFAAAGGGLSFAAAATVATASAHLRRSVEVKMRVLVGVEPRRRIVFWVQLCVMVVLLAIFVGSVAAGRDFGTRW